MRSDQGKVYTSYAYQHAVKEKGITMSMSRKGTPADNSRIETFHSSLKSETFYLDGIHHIYKEDNSLLRLLITRLGILDFVFI